MHIPRTTPLRFRVALLAMLTALVSACHDNPAAPPEARQQEASSPHLGYTEYSAGLPTIGLPTGRLIHIMNLGYYYGQRCLDVQDGVARDNQFVNHAPCTFTDRQTFRAILWLTSPSTPGVVVLQSQLDPRYCLDVPGTGEVWLQLYTCHYGPRQKFQLPPIDARSSGPTTGPIFTGASALTKVLDAPAPFSSGFVRQSPYTRSTSLWRFVRASDRTWL